MELKHLPCWRYTREGAEQLVMTQAELESLGPEWLDRPTAHLTEDEYAALCAGLGLEQIQDEKPVEEPAVDADRPPVDMTKRCQLCREYGHTKKTCPNLSRPPAQKEA